MKLEPLPRQRVQLRLAERMELEALGLQLGADVVARYSERLCAKHPHFDGLGHSATISISRAMTAIRQIGIRGLASSIGRHPLAWG